MPLRTLTYLILLTFLTACLTATPAPTPTPNSNSNDINLDQTTQALIASADRVAFIIPFSHWDTDWHEDFAAYSKRSDGNILAAIQLAKGDPRFRYTFEQVLFVQHFWENYPDEREDLKHFVQNRQFTFAWGGIAQPETSLVSPTIQVRNLQLGQQWIADTFGAEYIPHTAWQSDAFGNSAAFPIFLASNDIPYLFIGRWQHKCDPDYDDCQPLPHLFYWKTPLASPAGRGAGGEGENRVLVAYLSYPNAWDAIHRLTDEEEQIKALRAYIEEQFARTESKYVFIPMGSDFIDPLPNIISLVARWNASDHKTVLVIADPETAFHYIATQDLPTIGVDLNPIWQAFYGTRPFAKIADKESAYYLTAADKFGTLLNATQSSAWQTAAINAHYDNIGAVSFDSIWESSQRPRFEHALNTAADDLASALAAIASGIDSLLVVFNPTSWERSEVIEVDLRSGDQRIPVGQPLTATTRAIQVDAIPGIGWATAPNNLTTEPPKKPASIIQSDSLTTLTNGLVAVTLDSSRGGTISNLQSLIFNSLNLISTYSDDATLWRDNGDVYGAHFGDVLARESDSTAQIDILAEGPLLARARVNFGLSGQTITKIITLRADSPLVEVELTLAALPNTSVIVHTHTNLNTTTRIDDLGFASFTHELDNTPIIPGDITYRRDIFYPITYWSDVSDGNMGLALITHGLQGLGGASELNLLLVRDAREDHEGVTDVETYTFRYAYLPHMGPVSNLSQLAYAFNQPLIPVLKSDAQITVQLPFTSPRQFPLSPLTPSYPSQYTLLSAESALVIDLYRQGDESRAVVVDYDPGSPAMLTVGDQMIGVPAAPLSTIPVILK